MGTTTDHYHDDEEAQPLTKTAESASDANNASASCSTASTTSLVLERLNQSETLKAVDGFLPQPPHTYRKHESFDIEDGPSNRSTYRPFDRRVRRVIWILSTACVVGWVLAFLFFIVSGSYKHASTKVHDPAATSTRGSGKKVTLDQVQSGAWRPASHSISWISGADGEDGLLLERGGAEGKDYLVVEDVRNKDATAASTESITLMKEKNFHVGNYLVYPSDAIPSRDLKKVLVVSDKRTVWRHSFTALYWIFDVATQTAEALDPKNPGEPIQLASWSPQSDAIVFTRDNNMFLRNLASDSIIQITTDGGPDFFYGIPDWVYEEEVLSGNKATWFSEDGRYIAFLRTNESAVPTYPVQYFVKRPSGTEPSPGKENYPEVKEIKYPKAGAPNPVVDLQFYDVGAQQVLAVPIDGDFADEDRLITEVVWAGQSGKVLVRETNRESDKLKVVLYDVERRTAKSVRELDVSKVDGGWFEVSEYTTFIPGDPSKGRPHDGYIDTIIHEGYDHLAYFTPLENPEPILLTSGKWEVVDAPSAVDLRKNLVYFVSTKESSLQRHIYTVNLDGTGLESMTDANSEGYYSASFSKGAGYALLTYQGPKIPWQKIISTPSNDDKYERLIEDNARLSKLASEHELPIKIYQIVNVDGFELNVVERRPPHFDARKTYPVLFFLYGGPASQQVDKKFTVDFQSYIASSLGYIVVTVDGRGTGFIGRDARCIIRGNIGHYESRDQIETAKLWAAKDYVDETRMAIWGWSYGGYMTLKTLEQDAGKHFKYGMAVAPVTDWRLYDSIYTERYMFTPQNNPSGYENASISNVTALGESVRFLIAHGVADDNVHMQNSLLLLDKLDVANIENYDVHVFPDSDHSIYFHNANRIVYDKLSNWLINAFNGEWLRTAHASPIEDWYKAKAKNKGR